MTITLFVEPESLAIFLQVCKTLESLPLETNYVFSPEDFKFSDTFVSNYISINMEVSEYLKLKYYIGKLSKTKRQ